MCAITASKCGNAAYIYNEFNTGLRAFDGGDITVETRRKIGSLNCLGEWSTPTHRSS
jgi:hypothetical protein